jgi:hypothetical protein
MIGTGGAASEKVLKNKALQLWRARVKGTVMKTNASSELAGCSDNIPNWDVIQTCSITC